MRVGSSLFAALSRERGTPWWETPTVNVSEEVKRFTCGSVVDVVLVQQAEEVVWEGDGGERPLEQYLDGSCVENVGTLKAGFILYPAPQPTSALHGMTAAASGHQGTI